jgi:hypothetical protein
MTMGEWKVIFDIFGSKYTGHEYERKEDIIAFNLVKKVWLQGSRAKLHTALMSSEILIRVYQGEDVGSVSIPLNQLTRMSEITLTEDIAF